MKFLILLAAILLTPFVHGATHEIGDTIDSYNNVTVYYNGWDYVKSHGLNFSKDGYCYGQKWQCVEFVIRYYDQVMHHRFPSNYGHARDFWNLGINQGGLDSTRGLYQYYNDDAEAPQVNDILVFPFSKYGHVCIVTKIEHNQLEVIQQNIESKSRDIYDITYSKGHFHVSNANGMNKPIGWLRKGH